MVPGQRAEFVGEAGGSRFIRNHGGQINNGSVLHIPIGPPVKEGSGSGGGVIDGIEIACIVNGQVQQLQVGCRGSGRIGHRYRIGLGQRTGEQIHRIHHVSLAHGIEHPVGVVEGHIQNIGSRLAHFYIACPLSLKRSIQKAVICRHVHIAVHVLRSGDADIHGVQIRGSVIFGFALIADRFGVNFHPAHTAAPIFFRSGKAIHFSGVILRFSAVFYRVHRFIAGIVGYPHHTGWPELHLGKVNGNAPGFPRRSFCHAGRRHDLGAGIVQYLYNRNVLIIPGSHRQIAGIQILGQACDLRRCVIHSHGCG